MAYAAVTWEAVTSDDARRAQIDTDMREALSPTDPEALTERTSIFDSDAIDLDRLMDELDSLAERHAELRWVLFNMRNKTLCHGWMLRDYDEQRGHDVSGSTNYPYVRGRK